MSMHKIPLTQAEETGLRAHGLAIGTPSQLSDAFRQGVAWGQQAEREAGAAQLDALDPRIYRAIIKMAPSQTMHTRT